MHLLTILLGQTAIQEVGDQVIKYVFYLLGLYVAAKLPSLIKKFEEKTGVDIPDPVEKELQKLVPLSVAYAEEQAHKRLKKSDLSNPEKMKDYEKLEKACDFILEHSQDPVVKQLFSNGNKGKLKERIEAYLGMKKAENSYSTLVQGKEEKNGGSSLQIPENADPELVSSLLEIYKKVVVSSQNIKTVNKPDTTIEDLSKENK